jgi:hypothetical protein
MVTYNKTQARISKSVEERKKLQKELPKLTDSISSLLVYNRVWKKYYLENEEVKNLKMEFYKEISNGKQSANNQ